MGEDRKFNFEREIKSYIEEKKEELWKIKKENETEEIDLDDDTMSNTSLEIKYDIDKDNGIFSGSFIDIPNIIFWGDSYQSMIQDAAEQLLDLIVDYKANKQKYIKAPNYSVSILDTLLNKDIESIKNLIPDRRSYGQIIQERTIGQIAKNEKLIRETEEWLAKRKSERKNR